MSSLSTQDIEDLHGFLDDKLLQFISDKRPPTTNDVSSPTLPELTEKELDELFNTAFEQHEKESNSVISTATSVKRTSKAVTAASTRSFAKPVSSKEVDEAIQRGVPKKTQEDNIYCANL